MFRLCEIFKGGTAFLRRFESQADMLSDGAR